MNLRETAKDFDLVLILLTPQYASLLSLRWISPALTWASRNIIPTSTTRLTATCWTLKCNKYATLLLFGVIITWSFLPGTQTAPPSPLPNTLEPSLPPSAPFRCLNAITACLPLVVKEIHQKSQISFATKGRKNSFKWCFVYSVFICQAAQMNWFLVWNGSMNCTRVVYLLCHSTCAGVLITTSFCLSFLFG